MAIVKMAGLCVREMEVRRKVRGCAQSLCKRGAAQSRSESRDNFEKGPSTLRRLSHLTRRRDESQRGFLQKR